MYAVGCGVLGQLGQGDINKSTLPKKVQDLMEPITEISTKYFHNVSVVVWELRRGVKIEAQRSVYT